MHKKIRKNAHRQIKQIAEDINKIRVYSLDNGFRGEEYSIEDFYWVQKTGSVFDWLQSELNQSGKLAKTGNNLYHLHIHSNLWYDLIS